MLGELRSKYLGSMVGSALGDAIGEMAFRCPDEADLRIWVERTGRLVYTDDTAMALGLAQSLVRETACAQPPRTASRAYPLGQRW